MSNFFSLVTNSDAFVSKCWSKLCQFQNALWIKKRNLKCKRELNLPIMCIFCQWNFYAMTHFWWLTYSLFISYRVRKKHFCYYSFQTMTAIGENTKFLIVFLSKNFNQYSAIVLNIAMAICKHTHTTEDKHCVWVYMY